jgi:hypothetical protein
MCVLGRYVVVAVAYVMFVVVLRCRVECIYYPCTHVHTKKKKKCTCRKRLLLYETGGMLHMVSEQVQPATWDRYDFR